MLSSGRRWWKNARLLAASLVAVLLVALFIRLGFWQLDRLAGRRANNARIQAAINQPEIDLSRQPAGMAADLAYHMASARGTLLNDRAVGLGLEPRDGQVGVHLLVPLQLEGGGQAVLVDRGWIPAAGSLDAAGLSAYGVSGTVTIHGRLMPASSSTGGLSVTPGGHINAVQMDRLNALSEEPLLPAYLVAGPDPGQAGPPYAALPAIDLSEGPHLNYAAQWFSFAALLAIGFPFLLRRSSSSQGAGAAKVIEGVSSGSDLSQH